MDIITRLQQMSDRAQELWKENPDPDHVIICLKFEGYTDQEINIIERWMRER